MITDIMKTQNRDGFRRAVIALQQDMSELPQVDCPLTHTFANGIYAREVIIPPDTIVIGKIHKHEHLNFLLRGEITVVTETGCTRLTGPCTFVSPPNTKRAAITHTEVVWTNVIATTSTDVGEIEKEMILEEYGDQCLIMDCVADFLQQREELCQS